MFLPDLGLFWEANKDDNQVVRNVGTSIEGDGHAGRGALMQGTVSQRPQKKPGQLTDVGHTLDELLWPAERTQLELSFTNKHTFYFDHFDI